MTLTVHRPARSVSSLVADDPVELAVDLPRLPRGITLDLEVLRGAACGEHDLELFYPDPDDTTAEHAAKQVCAPCPVREPCLDMALATDD
ncbi:MAG: Transcription factor WhiB, partial [Actinomycetia bacterium]|nr:Transcription factor WhiB [Actinomycetes bacterium]